MNSEQYLPISYNEPNPNTMRTLLFAVFSLALLAGSFSVNAQDKPKKYHPKHEFWYRDYSGENDQIKLEVKDVVSQIEVIKFKIKFTNKTNDFILVDPQKMSLTINGTTVNFKEKAFFIKPYESESKVLDLSRATDFHQETFSVDFGQGFSLITSTGNSIEMDDFQLPAATNVAQNKLLTLNLRTLNKETDNMNAQFSVKYTGNKMLLVDPSRAGTKTESGQRFANVWSKSRVTIVAPGEEDKFWVWAKIPVHVVDMQFANLFVVWEGVFTEADKKPFTYESLKFDVDLGKTAGKN